MELVSVRGLQRGRGIRLGTTSVNNTQTKVIDLDNAAHRRDLGHHSAIGQVVVIGPVPVAVASGVVASAGTTLSFSTTAGTLVRDDTGQTITVAAVNNSALTAADGTNPRIDLIVVNNNSGAVTKVDGTAAASPFPPAPTAGTTPIAQVRVNAGATTAAGSTYTDVAPRM